MNRKIIIIGIATFVVLAGFSAWYVYRDIWQGRSLPDQEPKEEIIEEPEEKTKENELPQANEIKIKIPDLDKEIIVNKNLPEEEKNRIIKNIKDIIAVLKGDYDRREEWLNLGIWRKTLGDYEGAKEAWEFVTFIRPNDPVAFHNLGDLYAQYLVDLQKAEKYYLEAIKLAPDQPFFYVKLHEFYRYFVKKPDLAEDILEKGYKATLDPALKKMLEDYRKELSTQ